MASNEIFQSRNEYNHRCLKCKLINPHRAKGSTQMHLSDHIDHGMGNLLNIDNPDAIWCRVTNMFSNDVFTGLSVAITRSGPHKPDSFVSFNQIQYFDGPLFWEGANIRTASQDARDSFISNTNLKLRNLSGYYLYEIPTQASVIHIIALNIFFEEIGFELEEKRDEQLAKRVIIRKQDSKPIILKYRDYPELGKKNVPDASSSVDQVLTLIQQGRHFEEILHMMPWLEPEDIQACLAYARQQLNQKK